MRVPRGIAPDVWANWVALRTTASAASPDMSPEYRRELAHRIARRVEVDDNGCWRWLGAKNSRGYGQLGVRRPGRRKAVSTSVHRLVLWLSGEPAFGMACHHCDVKDCCNPAHVYAGDALSNAADAKARGRARNPVADRNAAKTHCHAGHPYDAENTRWVTVGDRRERRCRACAREYDNARNARKRMEAA